MMLALRSEERTCGDPSPPNREGRLAMRFFRSCVLFVAVTGSLMAGGSLAVSGAAPAGASPAGITVNCPADNLQDAIYSAPASSTLLVNGTCTGNFYINKNLTLSGPATLDGGGGPNQYGSTLNVAAGNVVLNNLVVQDGVGIFNIGGGIWNSSQLTLNHSTVTHNTTGQAGGVFNMGQLTLNNSSVTDNTATDGTGGIFNCGGNPGFESFGLCTGSPSLTLNHSTVSNNVGAVFDGGGIDNDLQAALTLNFSMVSGNTTNENGGGIENLGTMTPSVRPCRATPLAATAPGSRMTARRRSTFRRCRATPLSITTAAGSRITARRRSTSRPCRVTLAGAAAGSGMTERRRSTCPWYRTTLQLAGRDPSPVVGGCPTGCPTRARRHSTIPSCEPTVRHG